MNKDLVVKLSQGLMQKRAADEYVAKMEANLEQRRQADFTAFMMKQAADQQAVLQKEAELKQVISMAIMNPDGLLKLAMAEPRVALLCKEAGLFEKQGEGKCDPVAGEQAQGTEPACKDTPKDEAQKDPAEKSTAPDKEAVNEADGSAPASGGMTEFILARKKQQ